MKIYIDLFAKLIAHFIHTVKTVRMRDRQNNCHGNNCRKVKRKTPHDSEKETEAEIQG